MEIVNKEEEETNEVDSPQLSLRPGRGFRPSTKREQIRMKLQQSKKKVCSRSKLFMKNISFQKTAGKPTRKLRLRPRFRPSNPPVEEEISEAVKEKEEELKEGDRLLQGKLEELAVLEQQLEMLEEVMRQPKQIKEEDDEVLPAKKIRKRVKKRRRKPSVRGENVEEVRGNGLGREVEKKVRKKKKEQLEENLVGSQLPSVFFQPLEETRSPQTPPRLAPSPLPQLSPSPPPRLSPTPRQSPTTPPQLSPSPTLRLSPSPTPRFSPAPTQPRPTPSFSPQPSSPAQLRLSPTPRFPLESRRIEPQTPTSPQALPSLPKEPLPTSIPILRSPIQFAAPPSSLPTLPSTRAPTRFSPSLNQISQVPPPFPSAPLRPQSFPSRPLRPQSFPRFPLPDFFSLPFPEMRQGRSSPPGGGGGLFNAVGVPQVRFCKNHQRR